MYNLCNSCFKSRNIIDLETIIKWHAYCSVKRQWYSKLTVKSFCKGLAFHATQHTHRQWLAARPASRTN